MDLKKYILDVLDFPKEGIVFKDITPLLKNNNAYNYSVDKMSNFVKDCKGNVILAPEARGFLFGCPVSFNVNIPFIPIRKENKLPREQIKESYDLEYGSNILCIHSDSLKKGDKVVIIDDLLATGGTTLAAIKLAEKLGAEVVGICYLIELTSLKGREILKGYNVESLIKY